jgi:hypothetical protein
MSDTKLLAVFIIVLAGFGIYLHSQGKLVPTLQAMTEPSTETKKNTAKFGAFAVAFVTYIFILSFLNTRDGMMLTALVVAGALIYNQKTMGSESLLSLILKKTKGD